MSAAGGSGSKAESTPSEPQIPRIRRRNRLGVRLMLLLAGVLAGLLLFSGGISYFVIRNVESTSWRGRQSEAAHAAAGTVAAFMQRALDSMAMLGLLGRDEIDSNPEVIRQLLEQNTALQELTYVNEQGVVLAGVSRDRPVLSNLITIPQARWFKEASARGTYLGNVQISALNEPYVVIATPAQQADVIAGRVRMNVLWDVVKDIRFGKGGQVFIVNKDGQVIAHTDPQVVLANTDLRAQPQLLASLQNPDVTWSGSYQNFLGMDVVAATASIPGTSWVIVTELPQREAFAATARMLPALWLGMTLFGILAISLAGIYINTMIVRPITSLRLGALRIGQGDRDHRIGVIRRDEVGQLAEAFNAMAGELQESYQDLEHKVAMRTEDLARSNAELEQFASVASHDLQEPLRMVTTYLELLRLRLGDRLDGEAGEFMDFAADGANRMSTLIKDLLEYSRVGTRGMPFRPVNFEVVLSWTLTNLNVAIDETGAIITHDPLPTVAADETQMIQLIQNLLGNAIKFRGELPLEIQVGAERCAGSSRGEADTWLFSVRDNGIGIEPQYSERIFQIFQRLHSRHEYPGTGIGLAVCRRIVERHSGRIWVESTPDQGSTFYFTLPCRGAAIDPDLTALADGVGVDGDSL